MRPDDDTALIEKAAEVRRETFEMIMRAGKGHLGGSFSCTDVLVALYYGGRLQIDPSNPHDESRDRFILSKAHASNTLHYILADAGFFPKSDIENFMGNGSRMGGHTDKSLPGIEVTGGSLGHGIGVGAGLALSFKLDDRANKVMVMIGDGESQEGSVWEGAIFARQHKLDNLIVITDFNKLGSEDRISVTGELEPLADKWRAFGWQVEEMDGHDFTDICQTIDRCRAEQNRQPKMIIAHTVKGKGMPTHEDQPRAHHTLPKGDDVDINRKHLA